MGLPAVERVAPELARRAEVVGRHARHGPSGGPRLSRKNRSGRDQTSALSCATKIGMSPISFDRLSPHMLARRACIWISKTYWTNWWKRMLGASLSRHLAIAAGLRATRSGSHSIPGLAPVLLLERHEERVIVEPARGRRGGTPGSPGHRRETLERPAEQALLELAPPRRNRRDRRASRGESGSSRACSQPCSTRASGLIRSGLPANDECDW